MNKMQTFLGRMQYEIVMPVVGTSVSCNDYLRAEILEGFQSEREKRARASFKVKESGWTKEKWAKTSLFPFIPSSWVKKPKSLDAIPGTPTTLPTAWLTIKEALTSGERLTSIECWGMTKP